MKSIRGSSFPEETARLTVQLANPEFLSRLTAEAAQFAEDARENRNLLRFPFHNPETILNTLKELAFPRRDYDSCLPKFPNRTASSRRMKSTIPSAAAAICRAANGASTSISPKRLHAR